MALSDAGIGYLRFDCRFCGVEGSGDGTAHFASKQHLQHVLDSWEDKRLRCFADLQHAQNMTNQIRGRLLNTDADTARVDNPSAPAVDAEHWKERCAETAKSLADLHEEALQLKAENARLVERDHKRVRDMSDIADQRNQAQAAERATEAEAAAMREELVRLRVECDRWRRDCLSAKDAAEHAQDQLRSHP